MLTVVVFAILITRVTTNCICNQASTSISCSGEICISDLYLPSNEAYTLSHQRRHNFPRNKVITHAAWYLVQLDLADVQDLEKANDGVRFLLFAIDSFSKVLLIEPLQSKSGKDIKAALEKMLDDKKMFVQMDKVFCVIARLYLSIS